MSDLTRQTPLTGKMIDYAELTIQPVETGMVMIKQSDLVKNSPLDMPKFGSIDINQAETILSIMPNFWLLLCGLSDVDKNLASYQNKVDENNIIITNMTDQYMRFNLSGKHARDILAKGCELDLSLDNFKQNSCARTLLAHLNVVIWRENSEDLSLFLDVSFVESLWLWLEGACLEYSK